MYGGVTFGPHGILYGTTAGGGSGTGCNGGCGTVFQLSRRANGEWTETVLHSFARNETDGYSSRGNLVQDGSGNLYGTTVLGGAYDYGTVFELSREAGLILKTPPPCTC